MQSNRLSALVILLGLFVASGLCHASTTISTIAKLTEVEGEVTMQAKGRDGWRTVWDGDFIREGDRIRTGAKSSCVIKWSNGNVLKVTPFTNLRFDKMTKDLAKGDEKSSVNLWNGKIYARAKKLKDSDSSFEIRTPTALAGVRGTRFSIGVDAEETTSVHCFDGMLEVSGRRGGRVTLRRKQSTTVRRDQPPEPPRRMRQEEEESFGELEDAVGAVLDIMEPVGDLETEDPTINIKGKTSPGSAVTVAGKEVSADDSGFFTVELELEEGANQIKITARNRHGKTITKTRVIKYRIKERGGGDGESDDDKPGQGAEHAINLQVTSPAEGEVTRERTITVSGSAKPGTKLTVNGMSVPVTPGSGSFSTTISLIEGENMIEIIGRKGRNVQTVTRTVHLDSTAPMLIVTQPEASFDAYSTGCSRAGDFVICTVAGQTDPGAALTINNSQLEVAPDGSFSHHVVLDFEQTTINVSATDDAGNRATVLLTRKIDESRIESLDITVSPASLVADGQSTAVVTVHTYNYLNEPADGIVTLTVTSGGTLDTWSLTTENGSASTTFTAGIGSAAGAVTITAAHDSLSASAIISLMPDIPPDH